MPACSARTRGGSRATSRRALTVGPYVSVIAHQLGAHFVYEVPLHPAHLAPLLVGLSLYGVIRGGWPRLGPEAVIRTQLALPAAAVVLSLRFPDELLWSAPGLEGLALSPLRCAAVGAVAAYGISALRFEPRPFLQAGAAAAVLSIGGATLDGFLTSARTGARTSIDWADRLRPRTLAHWGGVSIGLAWVALAGAVALTRKRLKDLRGVDVMGEPGRVTLRLVWIRRGVRAVIGVGLLVALGAAFADVRVVWGPDRIEYPVARGEVMMLVGLITFFVLAPFVLLEEWLGHRLKRRRAGR